MTAIEIQNSINQTEALIDQIENSCLYSDDQKIELVKKYKLELEKLYLKKANNIEVKPESEL